MPEVRLLRTGAESLPWIMQAEASARDNGYLLRWSEDRHRRAIATPGTAYYLIVETGREPAAGFVILRGLAEHMHRNVELKRLVVTSPGRGVGRMALRAVKQLAFETFDAHRLWLDTFVDNARARHLYTTEGFVEEGIMRECAWRDGAWTSLVLMSMLAPEWRAGEGCDVAA